PARTGRLGCRLLFKDIRHVLELLLEQDKVARHRAFDLRLLGKLVRVQPAPADLHHAFRSAQAVAAEVVLGKALLAPRDRAQVFRKRRPASLCMRASLPHRAGVRLSRSATQRESANFIRYDLAQGLARDVRRRSSRLLRFNANHARLPSRKELRCASWRRSWTSAPRIC